MSDGGAETKSVTIYTDGGCSGNPGPGGYGVVVEQGDNRSELSGGYRLTTNNRMEIMAVIAGLESLRFPSVVTVVTDSKYVHDSIMKGWARKWRAAGWKRGTGEPAINVDLWERILHLCDIHKVRMEWVKGHAGHAQNERCDRLAVAAAAQRDLPPDPGYAGEKAPPPRPAPVAARSAAVAQADVGAAASPVAGAKVTEAGQACRKCGTPVERRIPARKRVAPGSYYYDFYLFCTGCGTMYMVDSAKRWV